MQTERTRFGFGRAAIVWAAAGAVGLLTPWSLADQPDVSPDQAIATADALSVAFETAAAQVRDSVVSITSQHNPEPRQPGQQVPDPFRNSPFRDFFGDQVPGFPFEIPGQQKPQIGQGSGWVLREDGYIVTNAHVVEGADTVTVTFTDDRQMDAEMIGVDTKTDVAVVKVDQTGLTPVQLGDSDELRFGQWVIAVGNPFGLNSTITAGIVSATGRSRVGLADYEDFIQTDAAINPGNSGGPPVNLRGDVVGMNTAIYTRSGGYMGIGFAIPTKIIKGVTTALIEEGHVTRGRLGAYIQNLNQGLAQSFGFSGTDGVLLSDIQPGSPAEEAGLKDGDIVTTINGQKVTDMNELRMTIANTAPGTKVTLGIFRDGKEQQTEVTIGELEADEAAPSTHAETRIEANLGMSVQDLDASTARLLSVDPNLEGVVVTSVMPGSDAQRSGLAPKDIILEVGGERVGSVDELRTALGKHDLEKGVRLVVQTGSANRYVFLQSK
jgi:serine protease Do